jgi:hypothetical protein
MGAKAFSFTHRTKVFADGTVRKIKARPQENFQSRRVALREATRVPREAETR